MWGGSSQAGPLDCEVPLAALRGTPGLPPNPGEAGSVGKRGAASSYIDNHIKPGIGDLPMKKLTSLELQRFYKKLLTSGKVDRVEAKKQSKRLSPKTVRNINQVISSAMELAKEQLQKINPTKKLQKAKIIR